MLLKLYDKNNDILNDGGLILNDGGLIRCTPSAADVRHRMPRAERTCY